VPFPLSVYSAFYDNRTSLMSSTPQVVIIATFYQRGLFRCVLRFHTDYRPVSVPAKLTTFFGSIDRVVVCPLPATVSGGRIPVDAAIAWRTSHGPGQTAFRVSVEVPRRREKRGRLVLCLAAAFGKWQPRRVVEWLEMQRLLGVERVVVYNRSMSRDAGRVFAEYSRRRYSYDDADATTDQPFVELRQLTAPPGSDKVKYACQVASINDCMYRNMNSFRHIAVIDFDELIVPRGNFTNIPELLEHVAVVFGRSIGSHVFRSAHFFVDRLPNETDEDDIYRLPHGSERNSSFSLYLTRRRRSVSPFHYNIKAIVDADACTAMWQHYCRRYTPKFAETSRDVVTMIDVDVDLALKHHYRDECDFDRYPEFYSPGSCRRAMQSLPEADDVMEKYGERLGRRLTERYASLRV